MTETPVDIRAAAIAVVDRGYNVGLIDAVAEALMAERERCAKIAEDEDGHFSHYGEDRNTRVSKQTCEAIAAAIRSNPEAPHT